MELDGQDGHRHRRLQGHRRRHRGGDGGAGAKVIAHYGGDRAGAEAAVSAAAPGQAVLIGADFAERAEVDRFWEGALAAGHGRIDVLVNNAGIMRQTGGIADPIEDWDRDWADSMAVNIDAPARLMRHAVRHWLATEAPGAVIGIGAGSRRAAPRTPAPSPMPPPRPRSRPPPRRSRGTTARRRHPRLCHRPRRGATRRCPSKAPRARAAWPPSPPDCRWANGSRPPTSPRSRVFLAAGRARHLTGATIDVNGAAYIR